MKFTAGRLSLFVDEWRKLTTDPVILDMVEHCHLEFKPEFYKYSQANIPQYKFNHDELNIIEQEIKKLSELQVIKPVPFVQGQFLSPIFVRQKRNGEYRMILNLTKLNFFIPYYHFKMDTFEKVVTLVTKDMYFTSCDLRHAYYSVRIAEEHQKYFRFVWKEQIYQYTCFPNGLASCPRLFTKLLKPVFSKLRNMGHINSPFIDDSILGAHSVGSCMTNFKDTISLMEKIGFTINWEKSVSIPTKQIVFLGNVIDSERMIVYLPQDKKDVIQVECNKLIRTNLVVIRQVAKVIGLMVSSFSAVEFGKLHYRQLELAKSAALKRQQGNYDSKMRITEDMRRDLRWWRDNVHAQVRHITHGSPEIVIQTDSSMLGWGFVLDNQQIGGRWSVEESHLHINVLELLAIKFALKSLSNKLENKHVLVQSDSSTAVCYVNNMGGCKSPKCDSVAKELWEICIQNDIWISCSHIPGVKNEADNPSRKFNDKLEWELNDNVFQTICERWSKPCIDLFASRLNCKLPMYCSWKSDPGSKFTDAFTLDWRKFKFVYVFCPFSLLSRCIQKIQIDQAHAVVIAPLWPTQPWFTVLMKILVDVPVILPKTKTLLQLPYSQQVHPLEPKLVLMACRVSGDSIKNKDFLKKLPKSSCLHGEVLQNSSIKSIFQGGYSTVMLGRLIQFQFLFSK